MVQLSQSGRIVTLVAVSQGDVFYANPGDTTWSEPVNSSGESPPLNFTGLIYSTQCIQKMWFVDGTNYVFFNPHTNIVDLWEASAGEMPIDEEDNTARLICTWRGRIVLSGLILDPQNWFMSAVSDPTDWEYLPASTTPTQAIAGNNAPMGLIGDVVTALIPYSDDVLIFGGDHTIYMMSGDPMAGGQINLVSDAIGMAFGQAWCKDPYGTVYFVSNLTGIYTLVPGQQPQRISQQIEQLLQGIDTGTYGIRLIWDDRFQGLHVFVTPLEAPGPSTHFFYEQRTGAWWTDTFANNNHSPLCCCTFDGNEPGDRVPLIGSWDGFVRAIDPLAEDDDGTAIESRVMIGPFLTKDLDDVIVHSLQALLGETSGAVAFAIYVGSTAEEALENTAVASGTWEAGRNLTEFIRRAGHAVWVEITASNPWAIESIRMRLAASGKVRQRGV